MRFNIKMLEAKGFQVVVDKNSIDILSPPMSETAYLNIKAVITGRAGIKDPGLQDYVMNAFLAALQRAEILELADY